MGGGGGESRIALSSERYHVRAQDTFNCQATPKRSLIPANRRLKPYSSSGMKVFPRSEGASPSRRISSSDSQATRTEMKA